MQVQGMPDTCTGRHFYNFPHDLDYYKRHYSNWDYYEKLVKEQQASLKKDLKQQLDAAKQSRIVCVFAFLIEGSQKEAAAILESFGFEKSVDYHNYKYPDTSRRLLMYTRDMNSWEVGKYPVEKVNPFAKPAAEPAPVEATQVPPAAPAIPEAPVPTVLVDGRRTSLGTTVFTAVRTAVIRSTSRLMSVPESQDHMAGPTRDERGTLRDNPFTPGQWVAINEDVNDIPPSLRGQRVHVLFLNGRTVNWTWQTWTGRGTHLPHQQVVAVKRL